MIFAAEILFFATALFYLDINAQIAPSTGSASIAGGSQNDYFSWEIKPGDVSPEFLQTWNYEADRPALQPQAVQKQIRVVYLVPSDKTFRSDYRSAIAEELLHLQEFYRTELGNGYTFSLRSPIVEVYLTPHPSAWYSTNQSGSSSPHYIWFWENALVDGFTLTGGRSNDPNNRWLYYVDADVGCGQVIGGTNGVAVMAANDMRGLVGEQNVPSCSGEPPDNAGRFRWIGGVGHELAHSFSVPHPPGCGGPGPFYGCTGGAFAANSLMWVCYAFYPNTYFLPENKTQLLGSGFFSNFVLVSGRVLRPGGRGIFNAQVSATDENGGVKYARANPFGYYRFLGLTSGRTYTIRAEHKLYQFDPRQFVPSQNVNDLDFISR
jgi:hypothetical protein